MTRSYAMAGVAAAIVLAGCRGDNGSAAVETFQNPTVIASSNGELHTRLTLARGTTSIDGRTVTSNLWNGSYTPPVLKLSPGDTLFLELDNQADESSNVHYHGLNVSPRVNSDATVSDNIFVLVEPGQKLQYKVALPATHNSGLYWYHSHRHELAQRQVMGGLSGGIVIDGVLDPFPQLAGIKERILLLKDIQITAQGTIPENIDPSAPSTRLVNGQVNPTMLIRPNETQFLRFANIGSDQYYRITLDGHLFYEVARDGNRHTQLMPTDELLLPPGARSEVLIQGGEAGRYALRAHAFNTGPAGDSYPDAKLATLVSQGFADTRIPLPTGFPAVTDLRALPVAKKRTITFDESSDGNTFYIDSGDGPKQFDANRVDSTIAAGTVEEWTVLNATAELHVFHIHQTDFQVTERNGVAQPFVGHQDSVNVDFQASANAPPGQVKILIDFRNPDIVGKFVYHCHILEHEDGGMMAVAEVVPAVVAALRDLPGTLVRAVNRAVGRPDPLTVARIDQTLEALQAGSFCKTAPASASPPKLDLRKLLQANLAARRGG